MKKHPSHGESLALKGLFLSNLNKREEGYECVRAALKINVKSIICWHVYGLLYRADRNYEEALKCYKNALRFERENGQLLRDLAVLQLQMRNYSGLVETRHQLLVMRPTIRINWISLAIAYYLDGRMDQAVAVLNVIFQYLPPDNTNQRNSSLELQELHYFKSLALEEAGKPKEAITAIDPKVMGAAPMDPIRWYERIASLFVKVGRTEEAEAIWMALFGQNPDSKIALDGIVALKGPSVIESLLEKYPNSILLKTRLFSTLVLSREHLKAAIDKYILPMISKGAISAVNILKPLYASEEKRSILNEIFSEIASKAADEDAVMHTILSQHHSHAGCWEAALRHLQLATSQSSPSADVFYFAAKVHRRMGKMEEAADCMSMASQLDKSDRFLNSKTVKYYLRAGRVDEAKSLACVFVKKGADQLQDLVEMQSMWFAHEMGCALKAKGDLEGALHYFNQIKKHFDDFYDDQFDFHNYVLRKMTVCSYFKMLRYEDLINGHPYFVRSAKQAVECLLALHQGQAGLLEKMQKISIESKTSSKESQYLIEASGWINRLLNSRSKDPVTHSLAAQLQIAKGESLLALRSIYRLSLLDGSAVKVLLHRLVDSVKASRDTQLQLNDIIQSLIGQLEMSL